MRDVVRRRPRDGASPTGDDAMKKEQEASVAKRREFLKLAGLGSVGAVAAAASATAPVEAAVAPDAPGGGYRETAHVRKAYELARF
jgi:hypothetical protein